MSNVAGDRKTRSDKGQIMATLRDLFCIKWIAEMYAARFDQIQKLLSRYPDKRKPFKNKLIAETTTKDMIARWQRAGWIEYKRVLANNRGYAWVTKKGLALVDLDQVFTTTRAPALTRLNHIYAVGQIRLWMDEQGFEWTSERRFRSGLEKTMTKKGSTIGPIPDAIVEHEKYGKVAIEVELTPKKPSDLASKLHQLLSATMTDSYKTVYTFPVIWFYVPTEVMKTLIEKARLDLTDQDQKRISVGLEPDLLASR
jgi:hypothetical protein